MEIITLAAGLAGFLGPLVVGAELTIGKNRFVSAGGGNTYRRARPISAL